MFWHVLRWSQIKSEIMFVLIKIHIIDTHEQMAGARQNIKFRFELTATMHIILTHSFVSTKLLVIIVF